MSEASSAVSQMQPDPNTVSRRPTRRELLKMLPLFSGKRARLQEYYELLADFTPEAPAYLYWHLPRITRTLDFLSASDAAQSRWLDISSDPWFCLLAQSVLSPLELVPTGMDNETVNFQSGVTGAEYTYESRSLRFDEKDVSGDFDMEEFDLVTAFEVIEHLPTHPSPLFALANKSLKNGGRFVLSTPNICGWTKIRRLLDGSCPYDTYQFGGPMCHRKEFTPWELKQLFHSSGFEVERIKTVSPYIGDAVGVRDGLLRLLCVGVSALSLQLIRLRNLLFLNGSLTIIEGRKTAPCQSEAIFRC